MKPVIFMLSVYSPISKSASCASVPKTERTFSLKPLAGGKTSVSLPSINSFIDTSSFESPCAITASMICASSVYFDFKNFSLAGVL
ncbi:MAG: hypothetical protein BWY84_01128 [Candidatus Aerophobetes bacterium ADurb.Bin490]|nr:MAG: hypothetical protein BWY84_01128 [Candidatus Aerophobetes bacterium ADurb.Bin490]